MKKCYFLLIFYFLGNLKFVHRRTLSRYLVVFEVCLH